MTRGEKIAWIWVWSAMALVIVGLAVTAWRYWGFPKAYLDAILCTGSDTAIAAPACGRVLAYDGATTDMRVGAYLHLANMAKLAGKHEDAITHLSALIALGQASANDWNERGIAHYTLGRFNEAADDFETAIRMDDTVGIYSANLADALMEMKQFDTAVQHYTVAVEKNADTAEILGNRGLARYQLSLFNDALEDYNKAIVKDSKHADNLNERGLVRHALQDYRAALADFDEALKFNPDNAVILTTGPSAMVAWASRRRHAVTSTAQSPPIPNTCRPGWKRPGFSSSRNSQIAPCPNYRPWRVSRSSKCRFLRRKHKLIPI